MNYEIIFTWDDEADVWIATSNDKGKSNQTIPLPGLIL